MKAHFEKTRAEREAEIQALVDQAMSAPRGDAYLNTATFHSGKAADKTRQERKRLASLNATGLPSMRYGGGKSRSLLSKKGK